MRFDVTIKELLQSPSPRLVQMLTGAEPAELLTVEFPSVQLRKPDLLSRLTDGRIHQLEIQAENDQNMEWRMVAYYPLIRQLYQQAPIQQVLYIGEKPMNMVAVINEPTLQFHYELIDIRDLDGEPLLQSEAPEDNLIALLCRLQDQRRAVRTVLEKFEKLPDKARADARVKLDILSQLRGLADIILTEAKAMQIEWSFDRAPFAGTALKQREGRILTTLLESRFGPLPEWAQQKIAAANADTREQWLLNLMKANSLEELLNQTV
jgi:hypothetical protein